MIPFLWLLVALLLGLWPLTSGAQVTVSGSGSTKTAPNDPTTGTIRYGLAKIGSTGAIRSTTADTAIPLWIVVGGEGTNPNVPAVLAVTGDVPCTMDANASNTRGMFVVQSVLANAQCHAQVGEPANGMVIGTMADNSTTINQTALVSAQLIAYKPVGTASGVSSVALTMPSEFVVGGSPITTSGTLAVTEATQLANLVYASATSGGAAAPGFRSLVAADLAGTGVMSTCAGDLTGTPPNCTVYQASGAFALTNDVAPSALAGNVNNYAGCGNASICRLTSTADVTVGGLAGGADGRILSLCNVGTTNKIQLLDQAAGSSAANQLLAGAPMTLRPNACKVLWYDATASRWRPWDSGLLDPYVVRTCTIPFGSTSAAAPPIPDDDDFTQGCTNTTGLDWRITGVKVYTKNGTPSFNPILAGGAATSILTTPCVGSAGAWVACSLSGTPPIVHSFAGSPAAGPCSTPPCAIDANVAANPGGTATYAFIEVIGVLQ